MLNRRGVLFFCILLGVLITGLLFKHKEPPPIVVLPPSTTLKYDPLPDRWIPASWGWLWRLRDFLYGKRARVNLDAQILTHSGPVLDVLRLPNPNLITNSLRIWLLPAAECEEIGETLRSNPGTEVTSRPRITTADGIVSTIFSGSSMPVQGGMRDVGLTFQVLPKTTQRKTDLTFRVELTQPEGEGRLPSSETSVNSQRALRTNISASIRVQLPIGHGLVLMQAPVEGRPGFQMILSVGRN